MSSLPLRNRASCAVVNIMPHGDEDGDPPAELPEPDAGRTDASLGPPTRRPAAVPADRVAAKNTATMMMIPRAICFSGSARPTTMSPLLSTPMSSDPMSAPMMLHLPSWSAVPPMMTAAMTVSRSLPPNV